MPSLLQLQMQPSRVPCRHQRTNPSQQPHVSMGAQHMLKLQLMQEPRPLKQHQCSQWAHLQQRRMSPGLPGTMGREGIQQAPEVSLWRVKQLLRPWK